MDKCLFFLKRTIFYFTLIMTDIHLDNIIMDKRIIKEGGKVFLPSYLPDLTNLVKNAS